VPSEAARDLLTRLLRSSVEAIADEAVKRLAGDPAAPPATPAPAASPLRDPPTPVAPVALHRAFDYDAVLDGLTRFARALDGDAAARAEGGERAWGELERHPHARRLLLVRHGKRFHSWGLFDRLVEAAQKIAPDDPLEACRRAALALEVVDRLRHPWLSERHVENLRAAALRSLARAQHLRGDRGSLQAAAATAARARAALRRGTGDLLERAHLLALRSRLAAEAGQRKEAARLLVSAGRLYQSLGQTELEARTLVARAQLLGHRDPRLGAELLGEALARLDPRAEPRAALSARHQLAWFTNDLGEPRDARRLMVEIRPLYLRFSDAAVTVHRRWLEGRILRNLERLDEAEAMLAAVAGSLAELRVVEDLVLCALDLLELYGRAERRADLARLDLAVRGRLAAWSARGDATAAWARAVENAASRAAVREVALLFREAGRRLIPVAAGRL